MRSVIDGIERFFTEATACDALERSNVLKFCFAYFAHRQKIYTPLDTAYAKAKLVESFPEVQVDLVRLEAGERLLDELPGLLERDADVYMFVLDNILWSMMFYAHAAILLVERIKQHKPHAKVGLHSHKVTDAIAGRMFQAIPQLDFCLRGEPEKALVEFCKRGDYAEVAGFVSRGLDGELILNPDQPVFDNLDELPSPYLTGVLDDFLRENPQQQVFMSTTRGCPFSCHFCSRSVKFSKVRGFSLERAVDELEYIAGKGIPAVFMIDDCFIVSRRRFREFVDLFDQRFQENGLKKPDLYIMCRPEFLTDELLDLMPKANIVWVQIGLQAIHQDSRYLMGSGASQDDYKRIAEKLFQMGILLQLDVIVGLPNDTLEYFKKTFDFALTLRPSNLQIKQLYRNPNTLFDLHPEKYGLRTEARNHFFHVPFFTDSDTFSNDDIRQASEYVVAHREQGGRPKIKLITQFARFNDFASTTVSA